MSGLDAGEFQKNVDQSSYKTQGQWTRSSHFEHVFQGSFLRCSSTRSLVRSHLLKLQNTCLFQPLAVFSYTDHRPPHPTNIRALVFPRDLAGSGSLGSSGGWIEVLPPVAGSSGEHLFLTFFLLKHTSTGHHDVHPQTHSSSCQRRFPYPTTSGIIWVSLEKCVGSPQ